MDIVNKRWVKGAHGSAVSQDKGDYVSRAGSFQYGANATYEAQEAEKRENDNRFGVPCSDIIPAPSAQSNDADKALSNPHNFSNNPGFRGTTASSTRGAVRQAGGGTISGSTAVKMSNSTVGRSSSLGHGSISMPAPGDTNPMAEGGPQVVTSGYNG